jgi:hypothetical protein
MVATGRTRQTAVRDLREHEAMIRSGRGCCYLCPPDLDVWEPVPGKENIWQSERGICRVFAWPSASGETRWFAALCAYRMPVILNEDYATARDAQLALVDERRRRAGCSSVVEHRMGKTISYYEFVRDQPQDAVRAHHVWEAQRLVEAHRARRDACGSPFDLDLLYAKHRDRDRARASQNT